LSGDRELEVTRSGCDAQAHAAEPEPPAAGKRPWHKPGFDVVDYSIT
jgi:hypothetical protein